MTLASSIITDAYRESNLIPMGTTPTANQNTEALGRLNVLIYSTVGNEVSDALRDLAVGGVNDQTVYMNNYIPSNTRLVLNLTAPLTLKMAPYPYAGQRMAFVDVAGNLATYPLTLQGNGRNIEAVPNLVLNTNGDSREYIYRADIGNWQRINTLALTDNLPFPARFDDYFTTTLALRLNPRYGQTLSSESVDALKRARNQIRAYYHAYEEVRSDLDTRGFLSDPRAYWSVEATDFKTGKPFPWR